MMWSSKVELVGIVVAAWASSAFRSLQAQVHVIEIVADKDSRYKSPAGRSRKLL